MTIYIDSSALEPVNSDYLISSGSLSAFNRLSSAGHHFIFDTKTDPLHLKLIRQEGCSMVDVPGLIADISVKCDKNLLLVTNEEKSQSFPNWTELVKWLAYPSSIAEVKRKTSETDIYVKVNIFGQGKSTISTGLGFFDHMLDQIAKHALIDLDVQCQGDLHIDEHHTVEDIGIALGEAISKAIGDKKGLNRFGFLLPMDETQARIALDLSGRPFLKFKAEFTREYVGDFPTEMTEHFFYTLAMNLKATLHIEVEGENNHHKVEACFKGFARALGQALHIVERTKNIIPSSKGTL